MLFAMSALDTTSARRCPREVRPGRPLNSLLLLAGHARTATRRRTTEASRCNPKVEARARCHRLPPRASSRPAPFCRGARLGPISFPEKFSRRALRRSSGAPRAFPMVERRCIEGAVIRAARQGEWEMADVFLYLVRLSDKLGVSLF